MSATGGGKASFSVVFVLMISERLNTWSLGFIVPRDDCEAFCAFYIHLGLSFPGEEER